ncbi:DUF6925 family protein [Pseudophaeobacter sp. TrK17]
MPELQQILKTALTQEDCGWNMGSFGAIGEFHHVCQLHLFFSVSHS